MKYVVIIFIVLFSTKQAFSRRRKESLRNSTSPEPLLTGFKTSPLCQRCECPTTPQCPPGVSLLRDGCSCCKMCARQLEENCDTKRVCDVHKRLYCDKDTHTCKARPGRPCNVQGKWHENGALFRPSCRAVCSCIDGDLGCVPTCTTPLSSPASLDCSHPRLVRRKNQCCGEWVCLKKGKLKKGMTLVNNEVKGHRRNHVIFRDGCMVQTSPWSPCSKTCGFGISDRVTNDNKACEMKKEMRLCNLRPCSLLRRKKSKRKRCRKNIRHNKRVQFSLSGCLSSATYRPKYCGVCTGRCCDPKVAKTVTIEFICKAEGNTTSSFTRDMMMIKKCHCHRCIHSNNVFSSAFAGLGSDILRRT